MGSGCKVIYEEGRPNMYEQMRKYLVMRRPVAIYDFATDPF
jgi:hypothetical protein